MEPERRHDRAEHRSLHASQEGDLQREGRAGVLPAHPLLPDQGRRPGDRLSASDLRQVAASAGSIQQRVLLGHQPQPGRDVHARLVLEGRPGRWTPSIATTLAGDGTIEGNVLDQANDGVRPAPARSYDVRGGAHQLLPGNFRARARVDYFSSLATMQTFNTNVYDASSSRRTYRRQRRRRLARLLAERHVRSHRVVLQHDRLGRDRQRAAHRR